MKKFNDLPLRKMVVLSKEDLKQIKGASEGTEAFENSGSSDCLATLCNSVNDCHDAHCSSCQIHDNNGGICMP